MSIAYWSERRRMFNNSKNVYTYILMLLTLVGLICTTNLFLTTVVEKTNQPRYYVKSENQLLLCENLGLKKKLIPYLKALNVSFDLKYQTLQKL